MNDNTLNTFWQWRCLAKFCYASERNYESVNLVAEQVLAATLDLEFILFMLWYICCHNCVSCCSYFMHALYLLIQDPAYVVSLWCAHCSMMNVNCDIMFQCTHVVVLRFVCFCCFCECFVCIMICINHITLSVISCDLNIIMKLWI